MAIVGNDPRGATAIALARSVKTVHMDGERYAVISTGQAEAAFNQVRTEVEAEGTQRRWVSSQVEAEVALRNRELERAFNLKVEKEWWAQGRPEGSSAMRAAFRLARGPGRDLLEGLAENDRTRVDVARLRLEDAGVYASDSAILAVYRDQGARSLADAQRDLGPILSARVDRRLAEEDADRAFQSEEERVARRMQLERESARDLAAVADRRTNARMERLGAAYWAESGRTLTMMVEDNMSGTAREEGLAQVEQGGVLTAYQKLRFSMEQWGTDMPVLRGTLATMSQEEIRDANRQWRADHGGQSLYAAIENDTSGREQGDLLDMAYHGMPETPSDVVAAARRKYDRDRRGETGLGASLTSLEIASAKREVESLEASLVELRRPGAGTGARWRASMAFDIAIERANTAIDLQRRAVDSAADMLANAAAIVTAVVVGAALAPFTGGGSAVVAAAVISSVAATAASMYVKSLVKGAAYGREEIYTDLALGAVDVLVAALTAGLGNALLGRLPGEVASVSKSALYRALLRMGPVGRAAAAGQRRIAGGLARLGTQGALVRGLERTALLGGLNESKYMVNRLLGRGVAQLIEQGVQAVPTSLAASVLEGRLAQPGGPLLVFEDTLQGTLHSTVMGLGMAAGHHVGSAAAGLGGRAIRGVADHFRVMVPREIRLPTGDVLAHLGTPRERLADFHAWREFNPLGTAREFTQQRRVALIERWERVGVQSEHARAARRELLAGLPEHERGRYADVPLRSVSDADFARLGGKGDAHLLVGEGQAVVLVREGAPPAAARALLPEVQKRVFAGTAGMTVEAALPKRLRDTPIRIDHDLPTDEVRVTPTPAGDGPITGFEVTVGPAARPIDVALHAGEIARMRRWTGRVGDARMALARFAEQVGLHLETPAHRTRFEAAGELRKLGPIIEERIRRHAMATDPHEAAAIAMQMTHLLVQQERARRIVSGEITPEPRGYVAQEGTPAAPARPAPGEGTKPGATVTEHPPAGAHPDLVKAAQANVLAREQRTLEYARSRRPDSVRAAETRLSNAARDVHAELVRGGHATVEQLGSVDAFAERTLGNPDVAAAAAELLPEGSGRERLRQRLATAAADAARYRRVGVTADRRLAEIAAELKDLGLVGLLERQNVQLIYDHILLGPNGICFPPQTPVATPDGQVVIGDLHAGDAVLSADPVSGTPCVDRVTRRINGWTDWLVEVVAGGETLLATRSHRLAVAAGGWVPARLVVPGMRLASLDGAGRLVDRVSLVRGDTPTCNLEVARHHAFYAGAGQILVHNGDGEAGEAPRVFSSPKTYEAEIYYVKQRIEGEWVVVYVGSTNAEKLTFGRFVDGHLREGRSGAKPHKSEWAKIWDTVGARGERRVDTKLEKSITRGDNRVGEIRVEVVVRGEFTDLALAIVEQAHIAANPGLRNVIDAIGPVAFEKYYTDARRVTDRPCR